MPLINFICPDNQKISVVECLKEGGCRMGERCATRSYLKLVSAERPWTGKPSTTQLIRGNLEAFLLLTKDYSISPDSRAFFSMGRRATQFLKTPKMTYPSLSSGSTAKARTKQGLPT
jgi:hypothetical protein